MLDVVYNHLGPEGNYLAEFGPYFGRAPHAVGRGRTSTAPTAPRYAGSSSRTRSFWLADHHIDGLRLDVCVHALVDDSVSTSSSS
jgi:maltooligosyltrehalose trehalohydrolase